MNPMKRHNKKFSAVSKGEEAREEVENVEVSETKRNGNVSAVLWTTRTTLNIEALEIYRK